MRRLPALLLLAVVVSLALGGCGSERSPRASGVTERWLQAVSDTGRARVADDAADRAADDGAVALATPLLTGDHDDDDDAWFADLEVGRPIESAAGARVPFRLTMADDDREVFRTAVLERVGDSWHIVALDESLATERVPSDGGPRPATAQARHWLAAIAVGALITVASGLVVEVQPAVGPVGRSRTTSG